MNGQAMIAGGLVVLAAGYVVFRAVRGLGGRGGSHCGDCGTRKIDDFRRAQTGGATPGDGFVASADVKITDDESSTR
ncbi:MAG: hypothetical protein KDA63_21095 [Planctomycetales bacterium]|nr:hypothetical protein [Planctomycetales bacterium]